ncbi:MAG TPA: sulfur carrier protein ThiS [Gammaproteobacteria bacterium]
MQIELNGTPREVPDGLDVAGLIAWLGLEGRRLAVEVNREIVPRGAHAGHRLAAGDRVEVVHAIGGGAAPHTTGPSR